MVRVKELLKKVYYFVTSPVRKHDNYIKYKKKIRELQNKYFT